MKIRVSDLFSGHSRIFKSPLLEPHICKLMRWSGILLCCFMGGVIPVVNPVKIPQPEADAGQKNDPDSILFLEKQKIAPAEKSSPLRTLAIARSFLGTPYVKGCLDRHATESLTVNLRELDCWTFVENCIAIEQTKRAERSRLPVDSTSARSFAIFPAKFSSSPPYLAEKTPGRPSSTGTSSPESSARANSPVWRA